MSNIASLRIDQTTTVTKSKCLLSQHTLFLFFFIFVAIRAVFLLRSYPLYKFARIDDANIFFRYVENLFRYGEIIWNYSDGPVDGFSLPKKDLTLSVLLLFVCDQRG